MNRKNLTVIALLLASVTYGQFSAERAYYQFEKPDSYPRVIHEVDMDRDGGDIIISNEFDDFSDWSVYNESGTDPEWEWGTTTPADMETYMAPMMSPSNDNGFAYFNGIEHLLEGDSPEINTLIEYNDAINCSGIPDVTLTFFAAYRAYNFDQIFLEVTNNDWTDYEVYELYTDLPTNGETVQEKVSLNITAAAGGESDVRIRFRFRELVGGDFGGGYGWMIDDLAIIETWDFDQVINTSYHRSGIGGFHANGLEYYMISINQATDIHFSATRENVGAMTQTAAKLNVEISGADSYTGTSTPLDLAPATSDSASVTTTFIPSTEGVHNTTFWVDSDDTEEETSNDTIIPVPITVTGEDDNFLYARDNGIVSGSITNVASNVGNPFLIGNSMDIFADDSIGAVDIFITDDASNVGQIIYSQIMIFDPDAGEFLYADQTNDHEITADDLGGPITLYLDFPVDLEAGQTILVLAGHYGGVDEVGFSLAQRVDDQTVFGYTADLTLFFLTNPSAVMVRPHMKKHEFPDEDGDGVLDEDEWDVDGDGDGPDDSDGDDIPDYLDPDDDNDGIPTIDEVGEGDTDGDEIPDYLDTDDDGDGLLTEDELDVDEDGDGPDDSDGDGIPNYLDKDDDGDGVFTEFELDVDGDGDEPDDTDGDDIPDYLDTDDDGDGVLTEDELDTNDDEIGPDDTDGDDIPDYLDTDDDGDGVPTEDEWDVDGDGIGPDDSDMDGIPDYLDDHTEVESVPEEELLFSIGQNRPNPFSHTTTIPYDLNAGAEVSIDFMDMSGRSVKRITQGYQETGSYQLEIDGNHFAKGTYYYVFRIGEQSVTKRMIVVE